MSAVLAPELIIATAFEQLLEVRRTVASFNRLELPAPPSATKTWTLAAGFLSAMGGLIVEADGDNGREYSVLREGDAATLATSGDAVFPDLGPRQIKDKSKTDSFAKLFALGQSTWLVVNVMGRAAYHLPITPIHIAAWTFEFPTVGERVAWRVCALFSTVAPLAAAILPVFLPGLDHASTWVHYTCTLLYFGLFCGLGVAYVAARVVLLVLCCMAMRSLPSGCYTMVDWLGSLPHF